MNGTALWRTTNDGRSWKTITPPGLRGQDVSGRVVDVDFLDAQHGWLSAELNGSVSVNGSLRYGGIYSTSDGGKHWHLVTLPGCYQCASTYLDFLNARTGYAAATGESSHQTQIERLYATGDGGRHWRSIGPLAFNGQITFTDPRHGWAISNPSEWKLSGPIGGGILYRTSNGGRSWRRVVLPTPDAYKGEHQIATWMRFFDARHGLVASLVLDRATKRLRVLVDVTNNGGTTWTVRSAPLSSEQPRTQDGMPYAPFSAVSTHDWMLFSRTRPVLFRTNDGGRSWKRVETTPNPKPASVWGPDFVTASQGWAIFLSGDSRAVLVRTLDGGHTWTPLAPPMPKQASTPVPKPACGSACQRP